MTARPIKNPSLHDDYELLSSGFDATGIGICFLDEQGIFLRVNRALSQMLGYPPDDIVGRPWTLAAPPEVAVDGRRFIAELFSERPRLPDEWHVRRADGTLLTALVSFKAITLTGGLRRMIVTFTDIEGHKTAQETALRRSQDLYRNVVENVSEAIVVVQGDRIIYGNPRTAALSGFALDELLQIPFTSLVHPDDLADVMQRYQRRMSDTLSVTRYVQFRVVRRDGQVLWVESSAVRIDWEGQPAMLAFLSDQSERRRQQEALIKSEEHHRQVVDNAIEGILVVQDGRIVFANERVLQLTGYARHQLIGQALGHDVHPEDRPMVMDRYARRMRGEEVGQNAFFRVINKFTGKTIWAEAAVVTIEWEGRSAALTFINDITERKRLEDSLKHSMAERIRLETRQIQADLKEAELARRHAEETTRAKSMFLANMSHEIRTPMNAIIGMAHLALRTGLNSRQRDYVEKIRSAGISLLGVINDILDFSKIEAGKLAMEHVSFNLDDVLNNVATVTGAGAQEKKLEFLFQIPLDIPRGLVGDPLRLGQVLINLINNAIKFTDQGEVFVACRQLDMRAGKIQLQFIVHDTGIGMSAEQTAKLFRAFSQADESTTRKYGGTGLGLSISKRLVELMGGTIWLESEVGIGTTIRFTAWFDLAEAQERHRTPSQELDGLRLLVVDDNPTARAVLVESLAALPVRVDVARNAGEALDMIHSADGEAPYSVVFTDFDMPGMDGLDLINAVKHDDTLTAPPRMVLLTAHGREEARQHVEHMKADGFLHKPINASGLVDGLVDMFRPRPRNSPARTSEKLPRFRDLNILLVEDNEINQQIAIELMQAVGIRVEVAANGRIALDRLMTGGPQRYGLVFMDVQMPEMDGHEATRRIRADARYAKLPILAMTAHALVDERERCFAAGMNGHLAKPINPSELYAAISRWCPQCLAGDGQGDAPATSVDDEPEMAIAGIDVQNGLARTLGNREFFLQMLARFRDAQRHSAFEIRSALQEDREQAERLAHSLRGVAALLGAVPLRDLAAQLERAIRQGAPEGETDPLLDQLEAMLGALDTAIGKVLTPAQPAAGLRTDQEKR